MKTLAEFHQKLDRVTEIAWWKYWRINCACAVQPRSFKRMPGIVGVCDGLTKQFMPERVGVLQLAPNQWGNQISQLTTAEVDGKVVLAFVRPDVAQGVRDSLPFPGGAPKARPITREPQLSPAYQSSALPSGNRSARGVCAEPAGGPDSRG
jgi:hypothetical protein